jgi:FkbM family methyltransferase
MPGGGEIMLQYREVIGLSTLLNGGFEIVELQCLRTYAKPGTTVIDVGANVGIFTISLAEAVGSSGRVMAFEPLPANVKRLQANVDLNKLGNVNIYVLALGDSEGEITLHLSDDPAFPSTTEVVQNRGTDEVLAVPVARLDRIWKEAGFPAVAAVKIDVEGGELAVLKGSEELLATCRPVLLMEANAPPHLERLTDWLSRHGYVHTQPGEFARWNHLFIWKGDRQ